MKKLLFVLLGLSPLFLEAQPKDSTQTEKGITTTVTPAILHVTDPKVKYKSTVVSMPYRYVRDDGHSPLTHRGPSFQIAKYNERWRTKAGIVRCITKYEMVLGIGSLKTNKNKVNTVTSAPALLMEVNYHYMRPVSSLFKGKGNWYLGGIFTNTFDGRLYGFLPNNSFGYEFSNVLNPATELTYAFALGKNERKYQAGVKLNFALLAHVLRPNYIGMEPPETYNDEKIRVGAIFTNGNRIVLPNRFIRVNTEVYLDRFKKVSNDKFRIFYGWGLHITNLPQSNPLYTAYHSIGIVTMLYSEKARKSKNTLPK